MGPRIREDNGKGESGGARFPNRPYEGVGRTAYNGRPQGSPLQGKDGGVGEGGWVPASARTTGRGSRGRAVPEPPLRGGHTAYYGRPQGSPLQEKDGGVGEGEWIPAFARTTGRGSRGGARFPNRPYEGLVAQHITGDHKGRPYGRRMAGWGKGNGSPHSRGQREGESGGRAVPEPPLRGVGRTAYNGRPQGSPLQGEDGRVGKGGWVPASARTTGGGVGGGRFPNRPYEGLVAQHITGDHKGRPYRGRMAGWGKGDGSPHPRGQREGGKDIHPHPPSSRGQALTFPHQGGRDF